MRTLPAALQTAQQAVTGQPVISAVLRAKRGSAARLDPTSLYTNSLTDAACAVAAPANGAIVRAHLSGGNVQTQSLAASGGSAWTTWSTIEAATVPAAGLGVALAALVDTVAIAYIKSGATTTARVRRSTNDGATWGAAVDVANTGIITDLALAYAPNGDLVLVTADSGGTVRAFRSNGGGAWGAAVTLVPAGAITITSIALAYSGDWLALFGWADGALDYVASALFGNGGQQTANAWSAVVDVLGIAPGNAAQPVVSGLAWGTDGGHALLVERWAILGGYTNNQCFAMECSSPAAFAGGYWTEPAPFAANGSNGADIAPSQATSGQYAAAGENAVATLAPPADVDVSARVVGIDYTAGYHSGQLVLTLDNSDQGLSGLATGRGAIGQRLDLALGYTTQSGNQTSPFPLRWVVKVEDSWVSGRHLLTLTAHDGWQLLHQLAARRQAQFGTSLGLPSRTGDQLIRWLLARAGIDYTVPVGSSLRARTPDYTVLPGVTFGTLMLDLLDTVEGFLLLTDTGATVIPMGAGEASTYSYGGVGQHPLLQVFHTQELQPANIITVYTGDKGNVITAQAFDASDGRLLGHTAHDHADAQLDPSLAQTLANALLRKAQLSGPTHSLICMPQVAQELGDVVTVTDPLTSTVFTGRVQSFRFQFDRDRGLWQHSMTTSAV